MKFCRLFVILSFALAGCLEKEPSTQDIISPKLENGNAQRAYLSESRNNYCFYRLENKGDWNDISISDSTTKNIIKYTMLYEENTVLLPPISFQGKVWLATGCDEPFVEGIFSPLQYVITNIPYSEYRDQLKRASEDYSIIDLNQ